MDLNGTFINGADGQPARPMYRPHASSRDYRVHAYFDKIEDRLVGAIQCAPAVVGCVAWLTNHHILDALSDCLAVSIVIQKEEFYRRAGSDRAEGPGSLRHRYDRLPSKLNRFYENIGILTGMEPLFKPGRADAARIEAVRCVGGFNRQGSASFPRMHHKFIVLCHLDARDPACVGSGLSQLIPYEVWTGSFNFTANATRSFENVVRMHEPTLAAAYALEWSNLAAISEPLDWSSDDPSPEWRLGEDIHRLPEDLANPLGIGPGATPLRPPPPGDWIHHEVARPEGA
jgi:hypothetical protein